MKLTIDNSRMVRAIMDNLTACGAKPTATISANGDAIIKVNAPAVDGGKNNDKKTN